MLYTSKPEIFNPKFEIVSCFIEHQNEILLLHRQDHKSEGNTWGVPAGKVDEGEHRDTAIIREIVEETGIQIDEVKHFKELYVKYPDYDFIYHIYHKEIDSKPDVKINPGEHKGHAWKTPIEALNEDLIQDEDACIKMFYGI